MTEQADTDELATRIALDLATLVDTGIKKLTGAEQNLLNTAMRDGAHLMLLVVMNPAPVFICSLSRDPNDDPIEIFRLSLSRQAMTLLTSRRQTAGH